MKHSQNTKVREVVKKANEKLVKIYFFKNDFGEQFNKHANSRGWFSLGNFPIDEEGWMIKRSQDTIIQIVYDYEMLVDKFSINMKRKVMLLT